MTAIVVPIPSSAGSLPATAGPAQPPAAGLGFERILLTELTRAMTASAGLDDGAAKILTAQLPDVLADAMAAGGGIGLASALAPVPGTPRATS